MTFFGEALRMANRSLWNNKVRSGLTILGVVVGIAVVVAITSLAASFEDAIVSEFDDIDDNTIFVTASITDTQQGPPDAGGLGTVFTEHDQRELEDLDGVDTVVPSGTILVASLSYEGRTIPQGIIQAVSSEEPAIHDDDLYEDGEVFDDGEEGLVIGWTVALRLGGQDSDEEPDLRAGDDVTISYLDGSEQTVPIIGILAQSDSLVFQRDGSVFAPIDPFYTKTIQSPATGDNERVFDGFTVLASGSADIEELKDDIIAYIEDDSDAAALTQDIDDIEFLVATAADIQEGISQAFGQVTIFFGAIAGVSLFVAAIMIGTIMLISVTERTKEIGVMKAIGGRNRDILTMFLIEAAIIGVIGSIIGVAVGALGGFALVEGLLADQDISYFVAVEWLWGGVLLGLAIGLIAGFAPARRATKIQPVEALSYE